MLSITTFTFAAQAADKKPSTDTCDAANKEYYIQISQLNYPRDLKKIQQVADNWFGICGQTEAVFRLRLLVSIASETFTEEESYDYNVLAQFRKYKIEATYLQNLGSRAPRARFKRAYHDNEAKMFYEFTKALALQLQKKQKVGTAQLLICKVYSDDFAYFEANILSQRFKDTVLQEYAKEFINNRERIEHIGIELVHGSWLPTSNLGDVLGNHPITGINTIIGSGRIGLMLPFLLTYNRSQNQYRTKDVHGKIQKTNNFEGIYFGALVTVELFDFERFFPFITIGLTYNEFRTFEGVKPVAGKKNNNSVKLSSSAFSSGLGIRYYFPNTEIFYLTTEARFNFFEFQNTGGTNLKGDVLTLFFGVAYSYKREQKSVADILSY